MSIRNNVSLIGNLGGNPTTTTLDSGLTITEFSLATNEYFRDRDGERQTRTMWHNVKSFGKQAEILGQYLSSGSMVAIEGRISYRKWIDKHEQVRISTEIIAEDFTFLSPKDQPSQQGYERTAQSATESVTVNEPRTNTKQGKPSRKKASKSNTAASSTAKTRKPTNKTVVATAVTEDELPF